LHVVTACPCTRYLLNTAIQARKTKHLGHLALDEALVVPATTHCRTMCEHGFLSHWDIAGRKPYQRYSDFAYGQHISEVVFGFDVIEATEMEVRVVPFIVCEMASADPCMGSAAHIVVLFRFLRVPACFGFFLFSEANAIAEEESSLTRVSLQGAWTSTVLLLSHSFWFDTFLLLWRFPSLKKGNDLHRLSNDLSSL